MPKLTIDGLQIEAPAGMTVLQACELAGKEIPRFCYHERLSVAGNCRMCLVEQEKAPKPIAACAMPVAESMVIRTDSPLVRKARQGVMEFLLINHPLDCPICDQGGECDLQDQAMAYGHDTTRYQDAKRAVADKNFGPLIKTTMTRCIQCTRCVRFATEIAGCETLGAVGRGEHVEILTYLEGAVASELSGNLIDICPVGALTSAPYAFAARPWELTKTDSIDVFDAVGTNIRIDSRGREILRVLPRINEAVNEEWLADKGRFAIDGLKRQRLDRPYIRDAGKLRPATWAEALQKIAQRLAGLPGERIAAIAGDMADVEAMFALRELMLSLGSPHLDCRQDGAAIDARAPAGYRFNSSIAGIDRADCLLLIGSNPRHEAPIINARIRKRFLKGGLDVASIGAVGDLTYPVEILGESPALLTAIASGAHPFAERLRRAKAPMLILGMGALTRSDGAAILAEARRLAESCLLLRPDWNGFNILHCAAARVGGLMLDFLPQPKGRDVAGILAGAEAGAIECLYLLGADEIDMARLGRAFVIYQGHHGDRGAHRADVILPGAAYSEKEATYVNTEGRVQMTAPAAFPPGEAKADWAILRALSQSLGRTLPFDTLADLRRRLYARHDAFRRLDAIQPAAWGAFGEAGAIADRPLLPAIANYYMTDPISRASTIMAACIETFLAPPARRSGTHG